MDDLQKIDRIKSLLRYPLKGDNDIRSAKTLVSMAVTHTERRLHQMMFANHDYERSPITRMSFDRPVVAVQNFLERGYSVLNIQCKEQTKFLFDVVCTLTVIEYNVFHDQISKLPRSVYCGIEDIILYVGQSAHNVEQKLRLILALNVQHRVISFQEILNRHYRPIKTHPRNRAPLIVAISKHHLMQSLLCMRGRHGNRCLSASYVIIPFERIPQQRFDSVDFL
ncbi:hypothetical protein U1Q18_036856 [Sarracenia purpurea var. burkii]